jgi:hypothetical protein
MTSAVAMTTSMKTAKSELKIVRIVLLVVAVLFATWIPNTVIGNILVSRLSQKRAFPFALLVGHHMTRGLTVLGVVADPIIYFVNNEQCRHGVTALFGFSKRGKKPSHSVDFNAPDTKSSEANPEPLSP